MTTIYGTVALTDLLFPVKLRISPVLKLVELQLQLRSGLSGNINSFVGFVELLE